MIKTFKSKALKELFETGHSSKINQRWVKRILIRLDRLDVVEMSEEMNLPGFDYHALIGVNPVRYSVHINGPWCITFEFDSGDAYRIDLEQ